MTQIIITKIRYIIYFLKYYILLVESGFKINQFYNITSSTKHEVKFTSTHPTYHKNHNTWKHSVYNHNTSKVNLKITSTIHQISSTTRALWIHLLLRWTSVDESTATPLPSTPRQTADSTIHTGSTAHSDKCTTEIAV